MKRSFSPALPLAVALVAWIPSQVPAAAKRPDPDRLFREDWTRHQLQLRSLRANGRDASIQRAVVNDVADLAVIQSNPTLVSSPNPWVLNGAAVQFTPSGNGYVVALISQGLDSNLGVKLDLVNGVNPRPDPEPGDDAYVSQDLGFSCAFYGQVYSTVAISSNGNVAFRPVGVSQAAFDNGAVDSGESISDLHNGLPRIAPYWHDLDGRASATIGVGGVYFRRDADRVVITWNHMRDFPNDPRLPVGEHTFQLVLHNDGRIVFVFQAAVLTSSALTGIGPGTAPGIPDVIHFRNPPATVFAGGVAEFFSLLTLVDYLAVIKTFY